MKDSKIISYLEELADAIEKKELKMTFGIQPQHIQLIESTMTEDWMWFNNHYWNDIAVKIGWTTSAIILAYQEYKAEKNNLWSAIEWYTKRNFSVLFFISEEQMKIEVLLFDLHVVSDFVRNTGDAVKWLNTIRNDETLHPSIKKKFEQQELFYAEIQKNLKKND